MTIQNEELALWMKNVDERLAKLENLPETTLTKPTESPELKKSILEFLREKTPKSRFDLVLTTSYFLEKYRNVSPFTTENIKQALIEAKEPFPENISDVIYKATKRGLIMKINNKKREGSCWQLMMTNVGEKYVEEFNLQLVG